MGFRVPSAEKGVIDYFHGEEARILRYEIRTPTDSTKKWPLNVGVETKNLRWSGR